MARRSWDDLPASVRAAVERVAGPVAGAQIPVAGRHSDFSAVLRVPDGSVFCKGVADGEHGRMHRHEADVNRWLPHAVAPRLRWRVETGGWLLLGFDHVVGGHADLSPGSADLTAVAGLVSVLTAELASSPAEAPSLAEQWGRLAAWRRLGSAPQDLDSWAARHLEQLIDWERRAVELVDGNDLAHTDLHPLNILVNGPDAQAVDWAWSRKATAAVDIAFLIIRLVNAGHSPAEAECWAVAIPAWRDADDDTRTAFAVAIWGIWTYLERAKPLAHRPELTRAAREWALGRLGVSRVEVSRSGEQGHY